MTAEEARSIEGMFGCIEGKGDRNNYPVKLYGTILKVDSYWLLFNSMDEELMMFSLRKISKFAARVRGKRILRVPYKYKKFVHLRNENQKCVANVVHVSTDRGLPCSSSHETNML